MDALIQSCQELVAHKGAIILGFLAVFLGAGAILPFAKLHPHRLRQIGKNLSLAGLNALVSPLLVIPVTVFAAQWALTWRPDWWQGGWGLLLDFLLLDAWLYIWHRANHALPVLWRFPEVHHLDETLDASTALRFHFGEVIASSLLRAAVIFLLGVPLASVLLFEIVVAMAAIFHHSNLRLPGRWDEWASLVLTTPQMHGIHHSQRLAERESNWSSGLSLWDRLHGTFVAGVKPARIPIGVDDAAAGADVALGRALAAPFV